MNEKQLEKYNQKRAELIRSYRKKKLTGVALIFGIALAVIAVDVLLSFVIDNIAVTLVVGAMVVMFSIIYARIRIVTVNHALQQKLRQFEQDFELYDKN